MARSSNGKYPTMVRAFSSQITVRLVYVTGGWTRQSLALALAWRLLPRLSPSTTERLRLNVPVMVDLKSSSACQVWPPIRNVACCAKLKCHPDRCRGSSTGRAQTSISQLCPATVNRSVAACSRSMRSLRSSTQLLRRDGLRARF